MVLVKNDRLVNANRQREIIGACYRNNRIGGKIDNEREMMDNSREPCKTSSASVRANPLDCKEVPIITEEDRDF